MKDVILRLNQKIAAIPIERQRKTANRIAEVFLVALILLFQCYLVLVDAVSNCPVDFCSGNWNNVFIYTIFGLADCLLLPYLFLLPIRVKSLSLGKSKGVLLTIIIANVLGFLFATVELIRAILFW